jgi:hypothetical protein
MKLLQDGYRRNLNDHLVLTLLLSVFFYLFLCTTLEGAILPMSLCPFKQLLGLSCPGCGLLRAGARLLNCDPMSAIRLNPLIILIVPYCAYRLTEILVGIFTGRILVQGWPEPFVRYYQIAFIALWIFLVTVRVTTWLFPKFAGSMNLPFCQI